MFPSFQPPQLNTPDAVKRQRAIAEALIGRSSTPGSNWAEGLGDIAAAISGTVLNSRADEAQTAGTDSIAAALAGLGPQSSIQDIAGVMSNPWVTESPGASLIASTLLQQQDPAYQLDLAYKQAQLENLQQEAAHGGMGDESFFGNIVPMQDENGNVVLGQASNQGRWQPLQGAEGFSPAPTTKQIDTGTEIITTDIYGNELYRTPKQNYQEAYDTAAGGATGKIDVENKANLSTSIATAERGIENINALESDPNLWSAIGAMGVLPAIPGTPQAGVVARIEQLQGGTFLEAYNTLKGGGQITEVEGRKAEQAIARLNRAQNEADFRLALKELKEVIQAGAARARQKAGQDPNAVPAAAPAPATGGVDDILKGYGL